MKSITDHQQPKRGFTLIEMLVVIAIMSILLTASGPVFDRLTASKSPATVAAVISGQLERSRSHAMAMNTTVWIRLGKVAEEPYDFHIGVFESLDGTNSPGSAKSTWSAPRFPNYLLSNQLDPAFNRPSISSIGQANEAVWIRFTPAGEAWLIPADPTQSRIKMVPPASEGILTQWIEIGLQPNRRGTVPESMKKDVGAVQLSGLTGQTLEFPR